MKDYLPCGNIMEIAGVTKLKKAMIRKQRSTQFSFPNAFSQRMVAQLPDKDLNSEIFHTHLILQN